MSYHKPSEDSSALGSLIGPKRPKYEVLHEILGSYISEHAIDEELFVFINVNSVLRQFFSEYSVSRLTRGELNRHPRLLAAELLNIAGHYRNFSYRYYNRNATILMYYSSQKCSDKLEISDSYKSGFYNKRLGGAPGEFDVVRSYTNFNLTVAKKVSERIPHIHLVDTGNVDPEAYPWILHSEGRVTGPAIVISNWVTDLQYPLLSDTSGISGREWAVLRASGDHSRLIRYDDILAEVLRKTKTADDLITNLAPAHIQYMLALTGDEDLDVTGIPKYGMARAAKHVGKQTLLGKLSPVAPSLTSLLEDGGLTKEYADIAATTWQLLCHEHYSKNVSQADLATIDAQLINRSGLLELEKANAQYFENALSLEMLFAGEGY